MKGILNVAYVAVSIGLIAVLVALLVMYVRKGRK